MGRILAIDFGLKRIGLAVTDTLQIIANPLPTIDTHTFDSWIQSYFKTETVDVIVIGMPKNLKGENTHATIPVQTFIEKLKVNFPSIPISTIDERFTSSEAKKSLIEMGAKKQKRMDKKILDSISATLILQTYLTQIK